MCSRLVFSDTKFHIRGMMVISMETSLYISAFPCNDQHIFLPVKALLESRTCSSKETAVSRFILFPIIYVQVEILPMGTQNSHVYMLYTNQPSIHTYRCVHKSEEPKCEENASIKKGCMVKYPNTKKPINVTKYIQIGCAIFFNEILDNSVT